MGAWLPFLAWRFFVMLRFRLRSRGFLRPKRLPLRHGSGRGLLLGIRNLTPAIGAVRLWDITVIHLLSPPGQKLQTAGI